MLDAQREAIRRYQNPLTLVLLAVVCYLLFFHALGSVGFLGPDEPRYSSIAREMLRSRDFVTPRLNGEPWFEKPVLMYWGAALGDAIFGVGEFGARFPSAIAGTLCVFFVYFCGRRLWGQSAGVICALVLASSVGFFAFSRAASMDMLLSASLTVALCSFLVANNSVGLSRRNWFCVFYASLGFGALAKGPIAFVLPGLSLFGFLLSRRRLGEWKTWHPGCAWITLPSRARGISPARLPTAICFLREFFLNHNFQRFTTNMFGHPHPFYWYFPVLLMLTFPWTFPADFRGSPQIRHQ
jgi:4-amino-4-deoxy-L-arabinose transferase-like glycosyltransferase